MAIMPLTTQDDMVGNVGQAGASSKLAKFMVAELCRQDPRAIDLSNGAMTQLQLFDLIDVVELASAIRAHFSESASGLNDNRLLLG